jgi:hypothetical protein
MENYDFRIGRAKQQIADALGVRSQPSMPQVQPMRMPQQGQPPRVNANVMPNGMQIAAQMQANPNLRGMTLQQLQAQYSNPQQQGVTANLRMPFQEGGLATSLSSDPDLHLREEEFVNNRDAQMHEVANKPHGEGPLAMAKGGGVWTRKEGQNPEGGLNAAGRASLKAQGHDIKPPVSAKQAKKSPKAAGRRKSFCARMSGMPGPMKDDSGKPTRKALALRKWDCKAQGGMVEGYAEGGQSHVNEAGNYTKPSMRKSLFESIKSGGSGGAPGQWSARKAQMLAKRYKENGGGYRD